MAASVQPSTTRRLSFVERRRMRPRSVWREGQKDWIEVGDRERQPWPSSFPSHSQRSPRPHLSPFVLPNPNPSSASCPSSLSRHSLPSCPSLPSRPLPASPQPSPASLPPCSLSAQPFPSSPPACPPGSPPSDTPTPADTTLLEPWSSGRCPRSSSGCRFESGR
jgi:hypothetical protein